MPGHNRAVPRGVTKTGAPTQAQPRFPEATEPQGKTFTVLHLMTSRSSAPAGRVPITLTQVVPPAPMHNTRPNQRNNARPRRRKPSTGQG